MDRRFKFRIGRLRWLVERTSFVTIDGVDDDGKVTRYLVHWNWPLSGQKCRVNADSGEIVEFSEQDAHGIRIHQTTTKNSLEADFSDALSNRLKYLKEHVDGLHKQQHEHAL